MLKNKYIVKASLALSVLGLLGTERAFAQTFAFPGAEGFGRYAIGGRNGNVYIVTNLNNSGPGSLRDAVSQPNRIVVFEVGGVIKITTRIVVSPNVTIAGQTAPGGGITVYGNGFSFSGASNTICRYIRVRMGKNGDSGKDAIGIANGNNIIFDHISVSWGRDETFSISGENPANITIQNSIIGQGLWSHSCGGLIQTDSGVSLFRNLYIDNQTRNPKVKGKNEFVNNIVYNWGGGGGYILGDSGGESFANIFNNLFIKGPSTTIAPFTRGNLNFKAYVADNYYDTTLDGTLNGYVLAQNDYGVGEDSIDMQAVPFTYPLQPSSSSVVPVSGLLSSLVNTVGGSYPMRDPADTLMIGELNSLGLNGITINTFTDETAQLPNGTGIVFNASPEEDMDRDGIPDEWELSHSLNPADSSDGNDITAGGYSNLELYINDVPNLTPSPFVYHPTNLADTVIAYNHIDLTWVDNTSNETAFLLERSTDNITFLPIATLSANTVTYSDTGVAANSNFYYRIKTATATDTSAYSPVTSAITPPVPGYPTVPVAPVPTHQANYVSAATVNLKWDGSDSTLMYHVYFGTHPDSMMLAIDTAGEGFALQPLAYNTNYYWRVDATGSIGTTIGNVWTFHTKNYFAPGIIGEWKLDESTGTTVLDNSIYGNDGEISNNNSYVRSAGIMNNGLNFNPSATETQSAIIIPNDEVLLNNDNSFSVSMWIKGPSTTPNCYLIHKGSFAASTATGATGKWWGIERNGTNFRWAVDNNIIKTTLTANNGGTAFFNDTWVHVVVVRSMTDQRLRLFVNGVLNKAVTDNTVGDIGEESPLLLGNSNDLNIAYKAMIDEVRLYNYALTEADALALYNTQVPLPVAFKDVYAFRQQENTAVSWEVGIELHTKDYLVQRSENGSTFHDVGSVKATQKSFYEFNDISAPSGALYYRIKALDVDGKLNYSKMVRVNAEPVTSHVSVVPNPVRSGNFRIDIQGIEPGIVDMKLYDLLGRLVVKESFKNELHHDSHIVTLPQELQHGVYQLVLHAGVEKQVIKLVIE
ncbi:MAG: LamG-like jellyroll fold domain-containing protein [Taibaiella sp.]|jgi:hypothetical protein